MMNSNELRIGNWVNRKYYNPNPKNPSYAFESCIIHALGSEYCNILISKESIIKVKYQDIYPIELTPAILEKAGFIPKGLYYALPISPTTRVNVSDNRVTLSSDRTFKNETTEETAVVREGDDSKPLHLHELQNIIYSITGKELNIEL